MSDPGSSRRLRQASTLGAGVLLAAALLVLVNYFGWKYHLRADWTASEIYTLSEKSTNVLEALAADVEAVVYMDPTDELYRPVMELLSRYEAASPRLTIREIDPARNPIEAQELVARYQIDALNVIVFDGGGQQRIVEAGDLAEYDYSGMQFGEAPRLVSFNGEERFTSVLLELTESEKPKVLFTTGHGELELSDFSPAGLSGVQDLLERDNFEVESWSSLGATEVPAGTRLIVVAGPTGNFVPPEVDLLEAFVSDGGRLLLLLDPTLSPAGGLVDTGLEPLLEQFGITLGRDIVVDPANPLPFFGPETIVVERYGAHPITRSLEQAGLPAILSLARSVRAEEQLDGYRAVELIETSDAGWGETDLDDLGAVELDDDDVSGPVSLGVALEAIDDPPAADTVDDDLAEGDVDVTDAPASRERLVVIGDSTLATNAQLRNIGNVTLLSSALNWLAERDELVAIPPKTPESVRLTLTAAQIRKIFWFVVLGMPALVVAVGIAIHRRRRS